MINFFKKVKMYFGFGYRLIVEYSQCSDRLNKLEKALHKAKTDEKFKDKIGETQLKLMKDQQKAMTKYLNILKERAENLDLLYI